MKRYEHGGSVYSENGKLINCQDMSANINALGMPHSVRRAIHKSIEDIVHYPDVFATALKSAIARRYNVKVENILTLNGAAEFFYIYFQTMRPQRVVIISPTFSEYERAAISAGCQVKHFITSEENDFKPNIRRLRSELKKTDFVVICRPNNPTGVMMSIVDIKKIAELAGSLIIDESFIDFIKNARSARQLVSEKITVVQSLTKIYALPGLRLGFAVCAKSIVERLEQAKDVWNVNALAQAAGVAALSDTDYIRQTHFWLKTETEYIIKRFKELKIKYYEPTANFVLIQFDTNITTERVMDRLMRGRILTRRCENFVGLDNRFIRLAIRTRAENEYFFKVFTNY